MQKCTFAKKENEQLEGVLVYTFSSMIHASTFVKKVERKTKLCPSSWHIPTALLRHNAILVRLMKRVLNCIKVGKDDNFTNLLLKFPVILKENIIVNKKKHTPQLSIY